MWESTVPMTSLFTRQTDSATFHLRWRGYDRAEVDEFLRQTAADRQRLQEDLAQLEAVMASHGEERRRELDRLSALRTEVASCLEASIGALRTATERLSQPTPNPVELAARPAPKPTATSVWRRLERRLPRLHLPEWMSAGRKRLLVAAVCVAALIPVVVMNRRPPRAHEMSAARGEASPDVVQPVALSEPVARQVESLLLTLTARRLCWIRTSIDGGQPLERLLKPNETILLRANDEAALRVGDAAALSLMINNQLAKPLGQPGRAVTARITRSNYLGFLSSDN